MHKRVTDLAFHTFLNIYTHTNGTKDTSVGGKDQFSDTHVCQGSLQMK